MDTSPVRLIARLWIVFIRVFRILAFSPVSLAVGALLALAHPSLITANEWDLTTPTGWNTVENLTAQQLTDFLTTNNQRIIDLEVNQETVGLFFGCHRHEPG